MKIRIKHVRARLLSFCAIGALMALNPVWADSTINNCAQVTATTEGDLDSTPNNKQDAAAILAAVNAATNEDDEACAPITVQQIYDYGDAPDTYGTLAASGGAVHEIIPGLKLGALIDEEADAVPNADANGDDAAGDADEDSYSIATLTDGQALTIPVSVMNTTANAANVVCWIDYNGDDAFATDGSESGAAAVAADFTGSVNVVMPQVPATATTDTGGTSYARCRLSTDATLNASKPAGALADGEVEDQKVTFTLAPVFDLALRKQLTDTSVTTFQAGDTVSFTIEVFNQGTIDATDIELTDYIPTSMELADSNWTDNAGIATLNTPIASLAAGATTTVTVTLKVKDDATTGEVTNTAEIHAAKDDQGAAATDSDSTMDQTVANEAGVTDNIIDSSNGDEDDHDIARITIAPTVDIELTKTVDKTTVRRGDTLIYTLTATNKGPDDASGVSVVDQLPAGLTYVSDNTNGASYDDSTGIWTVGVLNNGASVSIEITVTVD